jgi:hypothetical protein
MTNASRLIHDLAAEYDITLEQAAERLEAMEREAAKVATGPHRFPASAAKDTIMWECAACGQWVDEYGPREQTTNCPVDWRKRPLAARLRGALALLF